MAIRKSSEITDVNKLGMYDFYLESANGYDETVLIRGDRGYPQYYRVELHFFDVEYLACAPSFDDTYRFRPATEQEATTVYKDYLENPHRAVYCFEEDLSQWRPMPQRKAHTFFIVASRVEVIIYYDAENAHHFLKLEQIENR